MDGALIEASLYAVSYHHEYKRLECMDMDPQARCDRADATAVKVVANCLDARKRAREGG